jgi:hypothetical protein
MMTSDAGGLVSLVLLMHRGLKIQGSFRLREELVMADLAVTLFALCVTFVVKGDLPEFAFEHHLGGRLGVLRRQGVQHYGNTQKRKSEYGSQHVFHLTIY